jgi:hypothetical protein
MSLGTNALRKKRLRRKFTLVKKLPKGEQFVSMIEFQGTVFVASTHRLYKIKENTATTILIEREP